ncbi:DUF1697 domain-containing protein [Sphingomonas sp. SUN039]|uniref:DUF1697 domain-containing protein n=1 Tax=Sphingomonas sp. SUN039 TaxID=2937787 RepID=UPI0021640DFD|nr:DUF1697 domain-containing protein [Sphingomonas sp. SUN039]UVO54831.1 DUF1697 domain-containing protein [Sphingomonas sp. SUN039]
MTSYVALLRAVNVGGTGKLAMADLRAMGEALGFARVRTFIASGNLLFDSDLPEGEVKAQLEARLAVYAGKRVPVLVRNAAELAAIVAADPFPDAHGSRHMVFFYDAPPPPDVIAECRDIQGERLALGTRELFVDYGEGIRFTKLKIAGKQDRTGRNMNSVKKMATLLNA